MSVLKIYDGTAWIEIPTPPSDHGNLIGLADDDHSQYPREDGSRGFSSTVSGVDPVDSDDLSTKNYVDTQDVVISGHLQSEIDSVDLQTAYDNGDGIIISTPVKPVKIQGVVSGTNLFAGSLTTSGQININLPGDGNFVIDGATNERTATVGAFRQLHTPGLPGTRALNYVIDMNNQPDTSAIVAEYTTTGMSVGQKGTVYTVEVDTADSTGGTVEAFHITSVGSGTAQVHALHAGLGVFPIEQESGDLGNVESAFIFDDSGASFLDVTSDFNSTTSNVALFEEDDDLVYVGDDNKFSTLVVLLTTLASNPGVKPEFEFWNGSSWTAFGPTDGTNGFRLNGSIGWEADELMGWATTSVNSVTKFWVRIRRTANNLNTLPTEELIQRAIPTLYAWDESGDVNIHNLTASNLVTASGGAFSESLTVSGIPVDIAVDVDSINSVTGDVTVTGSSNFPIRTEGQTITVSGADFIDNTIHANDGGLIDNVDRSIIVTSDGATITLTFGRIDESLTEVVQISGSNINHTVPDSVTLTPAGTDTNPQENWIFLQESAGSLILTSNTTGFPALPHARVATVVVQTALGVSASGVLKLHAFTDHVFESLERGSVGHTFAISERVRAQHAQWSSGAAVTTTVDTGPTPDSVTVQVATGVVLQLHTHNFPALDTSASDLIFVFNDNTTPYKTIASLSEISEYSDGSSIGGTQRFNVVVWGAVAENESDSKLFLNLPESGYNNDSNASDDVNNTAIFTIPSIFTGTGFLLTRLTLKKSAGGNTWEVINSIDLRGSTPSTFPGGVAVGGAGITDHGNLTGLADNDHPQYSLVDGTSPFTGTVGGITPVADADLTTKLYVDTVSGSLQTDIDAIDSSVTLQEAYDNGDGIIIADVAKPFQVTGSGIVTGDLDVQGNAIISGGSITAKNMVLDGTTDEIQLRVQGHSTQTAAPFVLEQSDGTDVVEIDDAGNTIFGNGVSGDSGYEVDDGTTTKATFGFDDSDAEYGLYDGVITTANLLIGLAATEVTFKQHLDRETTAGITAGTTQTQAGGTALTSDVNEVSTVASAGDTVTLPTAKAGRQVIVINNGANTLKIYPFSGDDLGAGVDTNLTTNLATTDMIVFTAFDTINWRGIRSSYVT